MKDKEKQIEEIAREIAKRDCHLFDKCPKPFKHACISQNPTIMMESTKNYITFATWLVELGYRKLSEDSVVLSREEYGRLKFMENYGYLDVEKKASKETAENILKWLKEHFDGAGWVIVETYFKEQFGVEIKE